MTTMTVKNSVKFPEFTFQEDLSYIAERIFIPVMQQNIEDQISIDGSSFPDLDPKTIARKQKNGQGDKTLIATRDLIKSFYSAVISPKTVIVALKFNRSAIGGYLQITGIRTKQGPKFFNFFGINTQMENNAVAYMKQRIKQAIQNAGFK